MQNEFLQEIQEPYRSMMNNFQNKNIQNIYSQFDFSYYKFPSSNENQSIDTQSQIESCLYNNLKDCMFITYQIINCIIDDIKSKTSKKTDTNNLNSDSQPVSAIFCVEKKCFIFDALNILTIDKITNILKEQKCILIKADNNNNKELSNFALGFIQDIKKNDFVSLTFLPIACYIIWRNFYPTKYFKDPSFFVYNQKEQQIKRELNDLLFSKKPKIKLNHFKDEITKAISVIDPNLNDDENVNYRYFNENDFIILKTVYINENAFFFLVIHRESLFIYLMKKLFKNNKIDNEPIHEIEFCKSYSSRYLTKFHGFLKENDKITGFVYEYMCNDSLEIIDKNQINQLFSLLTINRVFQGISYLQSNSLIFRDLKPGNILIDHDFIPFISDFETIRHPLNQIENDIGNEITNNIGSVFYSSPEQKEGKPVSYPTDIYSFGMLIYFLENEKENLYLDSDFFNGKSESISMSNASPILQEIFKSCVRLDPNKRITKDKIKILLNNEINSFLYFLNILLDDETEINESQIVAFIYENIIFKLKNQMEMDQFIQNVYYFASLYSYKKEDDISTFYYKLGKLYFNGKCVEKNYLNARTYFEISASLDNSKSLVLLGNIYYFGDGVEPDQSMAFHYYQLSAELNNPFAQNKLAKMYLLGSVVPTDYEKAIYYLELSANQGFSSSLALLGKMYAKGFGIPKDFIKAKYYLESAARLNDSDAYCSLGIMYSRGDGVEQNHKKAIEYFELSAQQNNSLGLFNLGYSYAEGKGVPKDNQKCIYYYELAAKLNNIDAIYNLGHIYYNGVQAKQDFQKAKYYFELAANEGDFIAIRNLGEMYANGCGVKQDLTKAIEYFQLAAENNESYAIFHLGFLYEQGIDFIKDYTKAKQYYERAAKLGNSRAICQIGYLYENGYGVAQDFRMAVQYYQSAAQMNSPEAFYRLGSLYFIGKGVEQNDSMLIHYYELAAQYNHTSAINNLGCFYFQGIAVEKNYHKAVDYFRRGVDLKEFLSMINLAYCYLNGFGVQKNIFKAKEYYEMAAQYTTDAFYQIGCLYDNGIGVEKNESIALQYYQMVLQNKTPNYSKALNCIGEHYRKGAGIEQSFMKAKECYELAAACNNSIAICNLGSLYKNGLGVKKDYKKAKEYYEKAALLNESMAYKQLGLLYYYGKGVNRDFVKARKYFEIAAKNKDVYSILYLANIYYYGYGVPKDYLKTNYYLETLANQGNSEALFQLGQMYLLGHGVNQNYIKAIELFESSAKENNSKALIKLGDLYAKGFSVKKDYSIAKKYYELAARSYNPYSFLKLAYFYLKGYGVEKDILKTLYYVELASYQNVPEAFFYLGELYSTGEYFEINTNNAIHNYLKCIEIPNKSMLNTAVNKIIYHSYNNLGLIYLILLHDVEKAYNYIEQAAFAEYPFAQNNYGLINQFHKDSIGNAVHMFERASKHHFALAEFNLGFIKEVENNIEESIEYYVKASNDENEPLIYHNEKCKDKRLDISKTFIICFTNLKLVDYFLSKGEIEKAQEYFNKSFSKLISNSYKFYIKIHKEKVDNDLDYLFNFIYNFPAFSFVKKPDLNHKEKDDHSNISDEAKINQIQNKKVYNIKENKSIDTISVLYNKPSNIVYREINRNEDNVSIFENPDDLFNHLIQNKDAKTKFIEKINEILHKMKEIIYTPPYSILFGRINIENLKSKAKENENISLTDINDLFYEGLEYNDDF